MLPALQLSFRGDGKILRVTPQTARLLVFQVFDLNPQEKFDLELPRTQWRACGMGLIDHLHRRCDDHKDLTASELSWLERGLNQILARRGYQLFCDEGSIAQLNDAPRRQGIYIQQCGALFLLAPLPKERLALSEDALIVREEVTRDLSFLQYRGVKSHQGRLWFRLESFFSGEDLSITLEDFQRGTRRVFRVLQILPNERSYVGGNVRVKTRVDLSR